MGVELLPQIGSSNQLLSRLAMRNNATLKKISDHLNVSISTVSRALKDHPDVSPDTKKRVKELATLMDYEPNAFAVNLRKKHSNVFAIIVPEISNFFYHSFVQAVEEDARRIGYSVMILQSMNDPEVEEQNLRLCRHNHVAGIFVSITNRTTDIAPFKKLEAIDIPLVFFDKVPTDDTFNKVSIADYESGWMAAEHLLTAPAKHVLLVMGNNKLSITRRREEGFTDYYHKHQCKKKLAVVYADHIEEARQAVLDYFAANKNTPTAIFSMSDEIMCGVLKAIHTLNLQIPKDIQLLTISNGFLPTLFTPDISFVKTSGYDLGKLSFVRMQEIMGGKKFVRENFLTSSYYPGGSM